MSPMHLRKGILDRTELVGLRVIRRDTGIGERLIGIQTLEQNDGLLEVIACFLLGFVVGVAGGVDCVDTGAFCIIPLAIIDIQCLNDAGHTVFTKFMLPEALIITLVVKPVSLHIR